MDFFGFATVPGMHKKDVAALLYRSVNRISIRRFFA